MSRPRIVRFAREVFLTAGAVLGVVCIVLAVASAAFDVRPLVFRSGSMAPAIETGDLAISRAVDASSLERGDIVSVITATGSRVTHRIVNIAAQGEARQLTLKGDDNASSDDEIYTVSRVDRVLFSIPRAGRVVDAAASPVGLFVLGLYVAAMLALLLGRGGNRNDDDSEPPPSQGRRRGSRRADRPRSTGGAVAKAAAASTAAALIAVGPAGAATPWTKNATAVATFTTATGSAPVVTCTGLVVGSATLSWTSMPGATSYVIKFGTNGSSSTTVPASTTSRTFTGITSGRFSVQAVYGIASWTSVSSNAKSYSVLLSLVSTCVD